MRPWEEGRGVLVVEVGGWGGGHIHRHTHEADTHTSTHDVRSSSVCKREQMRVAVHPRSSTYACVHPRTPVTHQHVMRHPSTQVMHPCKHACQPPKHVPKSTTSMQIRMQPCTHVLKSGMYACDYVRTFQRVIEGVARALHLPPLAGVGCVWLLLKTTHTHTHAHEGSRLALRGLQRQA